MSDCKDEFAALVGLDWSDKKHDLCLRAAGQKNYEYSTLKQSPEAAADWVAGLRKRFGEAKIGICLEQSRGALINMLSAYENLVLFPINPKTLARFREAFYPSRAKSDPNDARLALEILSKHREELTRWDPEDEKTRKLALLVEGRRSLVDSRTELTNRLTSTLKSYFPQALELISSEAGSPMTTNFLKKWPNLGALKAAQPQTIRKFYYAHNSRSEKLIAQRLQLIQKAVPLTTDEALVQGQGMLVQAVVAQLAVLHQQIKLFEKEIEQLFTEHEDSFIFASFPGAAQVMAPRLLVAFGTKRERFPAPENIQCFSGIAPVTETSGKARWVHFRWACGKFTRQSFHEFARFSLRTCAWARCYYNHQLSKGKDPQAAFRALAFKWQRILWRCWKDRIPYDDRKYVQCLLERNIPIYSSLADSSSAQQEGTQTGG